MVPSRRILRFALFFAFIAGLIPAPAKDTSSDSALRWLTPAQEQAIVAALPPAPAAGSPTDQADLAVVLQAQAARTPAESAQVLAESHFSPKLFQAVLGADWDSDEDSKLYQLIARTSHETAVADHDAKNKWQRLRPFRAHPEVHPVYQETGLSYPSGHSAAAYACAVVLGEIFPDKRAALLARAAEIARDRVIGGVHYPSDIAAGQALGRAVAKALLADPAFRQELAQVKKKDAAHSP